MSEVSVITTRHPEHSEYIEKCAQNPVEQEGTYHLPEAQLDRFLFKINVLYPTASQEFDIVMNHHRTQPNAQLEMVHPVMSATDLESLRLQVRNIHIED